MREKQIIMALTALYLTTAAAVSSIIDFPLKSMLPYANHIIIGFVTKVEADRKGPITATVNVDEVIEGPEIKEVTLRVDRIWGDDVSDARAGERVLLFVCYDEDLGANCICASGRGRMPIDTLEGVKYVSYWPEIIMPDTMETGEGGFGPEYYPFLRHAKLSDLLDYIRSEIEDRDSTQQSAPADGVDAAAEP